MENESCESCKFWERLEDSKDGKGHCRVNAPIAVGLLSGTPPSGQEKFTGIWPRTMPLDWCGEYEAPDRKQQPFIAGVSSQEAPNPVAVVLDEAERLASKE